jgi:hypothetical protein
MYVSQQMLRVHHDEWLRYAEARREVKRAAVASRGSAGRRARRSLGLRGLRVGRLISQG